MQIHRRRDDGGLRHQERAAAEFALQYGWIIAVVLILLFGAKKLPELAKALGQSMKEFQKGKEGVDEKADPNHRIEPPKSV
jgi:sec-independent protein translocase protein TatA